MKNLWGSARWVVIIWVATGILGTFGVTIDEPSNEVAEFFNNLLSPSILLAMGIGASALIAFYSILGATSTMRAAIAASMTIVFFGLLLLPEAFTGAASDVMTETFIWAWTLMIAFYFGTEGAVQAIKAKEGAGQQAGGDSESIEVESPGG